MPIASPEGRLDGCLGAAFDAMSVTKTLAGSCPVLFTTVILYAGVLPAAAMPTQANNAAHTAPITVVVILRRKGGINGSW